MRNIGVQALFHLVFDRVARRDVILPDIIRFVQRKFYDEMVAKQFNSRLETIL